MNENDRVHVEQLRQANVEQSQSRRTRQEIELRSQASPKSSQSPPSSACMIAMPESRRWDNPASDDSNPIDDLGAWVRFVCEESGQGKLKILMSPGALDVVSRHPQLARHHGEAEERCAKSLDLASEIEAAPILVTNDLPDGLVIVASAGNPSCILMAVDVINTEGTGR